MGAPYRIASPPPPDPPDAFDDYEVEFRTRLRRGQYTTMLAFASLAGAWLALAEVHRAGGAAEQEHDLARRAQEEAARREGDLRSILSRERTATRSREEAFRAAIADAVAGDLTPGAAAGPCSAELLTESRLVGSATMPLVVVDSGERTIASPSLDARLASIDEAENLLEGGRWPDTLTIARAVDRRPMGAEVVVVASLHRRPVSRTGSSFEPGEIRGKAYVYDFGQRRIICAGDVEATSSKTIEYAYVEDPSTLAAPDQGARLRVSLDVDLDRQLRRAGQASLRAVP